MNYLTTTLPTYCHETEHFRRIFRWDEVEHDDYEGPMAEVNGDWVHVKSHDDVPAHWWTVAVYTSYQVYGGPEEGGWWYTAGALTEHGRTRFFDDFEKAQAYSDKLWKWVNAQNDSRERGDERLVVRCTTEALPAPYYPKKRPHYS